MEVGAAGTVGAAAVGVGLAVGSAAGVGWVVAGGAAVAVGVGGIATAVSGGGGSVIGSASVGVAPEQASEKTASSKTTRMVTDSRAIPDPVSLSRVAAISPLTSKKGPGCTKELLPVQTYQFNMCSLPMHL